jgi:hypothetical protein
MLARFLISLPNSRPGVGPASRTDGVAAGVKKAKTNNHTFPFDWVLEFCLESAANQHGRASVFFPAVVTCRSLRPTSGRCEGGLAREMAASAFHRASLRSRSGATCCRLAQPNFHIANGPNMAAFHMQWLACRVHIMFCHTHGFSTLTVTGGMVI